MAEHQPDPIDLVAAAIAAKVTVSLAGEIARAMRRLQLRAPLTMPDPTAAERQRRHRAKQQGAQ